MPNRPPKSPFKIERKPVETNLAEHLPKPETPDAAGGDSNIPFELNDFSLAMQFQVAIEIALSKCVTIKDREFIGDANDLDRLHSLATSYLAQSNATASRRTSLQNQPAPIIQVPQ
jgi:hypothetical protein